MIIHPMAIGDVVLGTPVAAALKRQYPEARITYFTHASLVPLLQLCPAIDEYLEWKRKAPLITQVAMVQRQRPDILVDLTSSLRTRLIRFLSGIPSAGYKKQSRNERPVVHVTDRYLDVLHQLRMGNVADSHGAFPTLEPDVHLIDRVRISLGADCVSDVKPLVALVPGVGGLRPNRAWPESHWISLGRELTRRHLAHLLLVGGPDDQELCNRIESALGAQNCFNAAGKLTLPETAALFKLCRMAISGDTGPCHIAVGVGLPVLSLMGPTLPQRSGPYGFLDCGFNVCGACKCTAAKKCLVNDGTTHGACMQDIDPLTVVQRVEQMLTGVCSASTSVSTKFQLAGLEADAG